MAFDLRIFSLYRVRESYPHEHISMGGVDARTDVGLYIRAVGSIREEPHSPKSVSTKQRQTLNQRLCIHVLVRQVTILWRHRRVTLKWYLHRDSNASGSPDPEADRLGRGALGKAKTVS